MLRASVLYVISLLNPCDISVILQHLVALSSWASLLLKLFLSLVLLMLFLHALSFLSSCSIALRPVTLTACVCACNWSHVITGRDDATRLKSGERTESLQLWGTVAARWCFFFDSRVSLLTLAWHSRSTFQFRLDLQRRDGSYWELFFFFFFFFLLDTWYKKADRLEQKPASIIRRSKIQLLLTDYVMTELTE